MSKRSAHSDVIETTRYPSRCPACAKVKPTVVPNASDEGVVRIGCFACGWQAKYRLIEEPA